MDIQDLVTKANNYNKPISKKSNINNEYSIFFYLHSVSQT